ncbi:hypothetical protein ABEP16_20920 [Priestia aryabhattai]|uniref:hypothetical protein n=1 Tax=Priestia aryabhattai TaxID=412384 RepID=UPI003D27D37A
MNKNQLNSILIFYIVAICGMAMVVISKNVLPSKYFIDSQTIREYYTIATSANFDITGGFYYTALFYKILGFQHLNSSIMEGLLNYLIYIACIVSIFKYINFNFSKIGVILFVLWNTLAAVYLGQLTKEIILLIVITFQLRSIIKNKKMSIFISFLLLGLYAYFFRTYWFLIIFLACVLYIVFRINKSFNKRTKGLIILSSMLVIVLILNSTGTYITDSRTQVNEIIDSNTQINNLLVNTSFITDILNWCCAWLILIFPVPLIFKGGVQHFLFFILDVMTVGTLILNMRNKALINSKQKSVLWSLSLIISFSLVQGAFEPDYGSYVKHQVILIPLYFYTISFKKNKSSR